MATLALLASVQAQVPLPRDRAAQIERSLNQGLQGDPLKCEVQTVKPFLDFAFRIQIAYVVNCPIRQFQGKETSLVTILRVTPSASKPVMLTDHVTIAGMPAQLASKFKLQRFHDEAEFSGAFAVGVGDYRIDLIVIDDRTRFFRKSWTATVTGRMAKQNTPLAMEPNTAAAIAPPRWDTPDGDAAGLKLTVLLDAAPMNSFALKLRAWDRTFLLDSVGSLLNKIPSSSVRLVAFNLDQQHELFRVNDFNPYDLRQLDAALQNLELGTVSYNVLQQRQGWSELLANLVKQEERAEPPADAVIFLGPHTRIAQKIPHEFLSCGDGVHPRFFYLEYFPYYGRDFPDTLQYVTTACNGTVLKLHSPSDLAADLEKLRRKLSPPANQISSR